MFVPFLKRLSNVITQLGTVDFNKCYSNISDSASAGDYFQQWINTQ